jgi:hypothetical protein
MLCWLFTTAAICRIVSAVAPFVQVLLGVLAAVTGRSQLGGRLLVGPSLQTLLISPPPRSGFFLFLILLLLCFFSPPPLSPPFLR